MKVLKTPKNVVDAARAGRVGGPGGERERGALRVLFLSKCEEIASLLDAGYAQRAAFEAVFPDAAISYSQFTRYVRRYIGGKDERFERMCRFDPSVVTPPVPQPINHEESHDDARKSPEGRKETGWLHRVRSIFG